MEESLSGCLFLHQPLGFFSRGSFPGHKALSTPDKKAPKNRGSACQLLNDCSFVDSAAADLYQYWTD
jgi:hypothetical protein